MRAVEGGTASAIAGDEDEGKERTMDPMFEMTISHYQEKFVKRLKVITVYSLIPD